MSLRCVLVLAVTLALSGGPDPCRLTEAAEPATVPASFAEIAAAARAASLVIRASVPDPDGEASTTLSVPAGQDTDKHIQEDGWEGVDALSARRNRTVAAGVIIDPRGIALTSARAVRRAAALEVALDDGTMVTATVVGLDLRSDVAVLRLEDGGGLFPHLRFGDSDRLRPGDWVISVGAPLGLDGTVSAGIVTATPAAASPSPRAKYIQSDAAVASKSTGGPLVDLNGELVGLLTSLDDEDVAYAIPSKVLRRIALELLEKGRVSRPWLGATTQSLDAGLARALRAPDGAGVLIADVRSAGPAAAAGLRPGDIILAVGTMPMSSRLQFEGAMSALAPGDIVDLKVRRDGRLVSVSARLGEEPDPAATPPTVTKRRLGVDVRPIDPSTGAVVRDLDVQSPAARAGIKAGDVIREVDRRPIRSIADFQAAARTLSARAPVLLRVQRGDTVLYIVVTPRE